MPELPEVETIRRVLEEKVVGRKIVKVELRIPKLTATRLHRDLRGQEAVLRTRLTGRRIAAVRRRAKYLVLDLDQGRLIIHLGMTGQIFAAPAGPLPVNGLPLLPDKHTHVVLRLTGPMCVYFRDIRQFGRLRLVSDPEEERLFARLGPEPLGRAFSPQTLRQGFSGKKAPVKALLLNQQVVAGLGNIYADEALFRARIHPQTPGRRITPGQARTLHQAIRQTLSEAIRFRGTTMSDYYDPESRKGGFQDRLQVYGRPGEPCPNCGRPLRKSRIAQRGTHWCAHCQK